MLISILISTFTYLGLFGVVFANDPTLAAKAVLNEGGPGFDSIYKDLVRARGLVNKEAFYAGAEVLILTYSHLINPAQANDNHEAIIKAFLDAALDIKSSIGDKFIEQAFHQKLQKEIKLEPCHPLTKQQILENLNDKEKIMRKNLVFKFRYAYVCSFIALTWEAINDLPELSSSEFSEKMQVLTELEKSVRRLYMWLGLRKRDPIVSPHIPPIVKSFITAASQPLSAAPESRIMSLILSPMSSALNQAKEGNLCAAGELFAETYHRLAHNGCRSTISLFKSCKEECRNIFHKITNPVQRFLFMATGGSHLIAPELIHFTSSELEEHYESIISCVKTALEDKKFIIAFNILNFMTCSQFKGNNASRSLKKKYEKLLRWTLETYEKSWSSNERFSLSESIAELRS